MKNISGDASNWNTSPGNEIPRKKKTTRVSNGPVLAPSHNNEIAELEPVLKKLEEKYDKFPNKNTYDAIVSLSSVLRSLRN